MSITDLDVGLVIDVSETGVKVSQENPEELQKMLEVKSIFFSRYLSCNLIPLGIDGLGPNLYE